jgi:hypothetical protein
MEQALMPPIVHHAHANLRRWHQPLQLHRQGLDKRCANRRQRFVFCASGIATFELNVKGHMAPMRITKGHWLHGDLRRGGGS